jgi:D-alanyl-D-alanine carboxypeptidase
MTDLGVLQQTGGGRAARLAQARRARRFHILLLGMLAGLLALLCLLGLMSSVASEPKLSSLASHRAGATTTTRSEAYSLTPASPQLRIALKLPLRSGLLFDVRTGHVLWQRRPAQPLPIASLTKMMTALVVATHARPSARVRITRAAVSYSGSGVGNLPRGKKVSLLTLLYGLMLPSGNDAAIALAQHVGGTEHHFITMMNVHARHMHLRCTHFTTDSGIVDRGNYSCADDLAVIAHAVLKHPLLARIVATRSAVMPLPVKGGKVYLYNNNGLMYLRYPGVDGVKTGYTQAAGRCLVASAKRGQRWLAVVLLNSGDPPAQARQLLDAGFALRRT